ncbi:MAG: thioredoxin family protein [Actinomycetota bacterium]|nr:thioredoxin family protein [Actinomycetota bacterium]
MLRISISAVVAIGLLAACGGDGEPDGLADRPGAQGCTAQYRQSFEGAQAYPTVASSELAVGQNHILMGLLNDDDAPIGSPQIDMHVDFVDLAECSDGPAFGKDMRFLWSIKPVVGLYAADVKFDSAGEWGAVVAIRGEGIDETLKTSFSVAEESSAPEIGEVPPATDTPTSEDVKDLSQISTDKNPDPQFYERSIEEALEAKEPFLVIFATPKFCQTQTCGPMLDIVKGVAKDFPKMTFIHVEPYELPADPSNLQPVKAALDWGLKSEPWTFVMDSDGAVAAKYEGALDPAELRSELKKLK